MQPVPVLLFDTALSLYEQELLGGRNLAPLTRQAYLADLTELQTYLKERLGLKHPGQVKRAHLESFLGALDARRLSGNYRRRKIAAIRSFFGFLEERGLIPGDPARKLVPPEREHRQPRFLTEPEYKRLLDAVRHETRDAAVIELLLQTGLRLCELSRLILSDVTLPARISKDPENVGAVHILGKGRRERTVTLNWKACKAIKAYLSVRSADTGDEHLFLTKFGAGIGPRSIERLVEKYLTEAGIQGPQCTACGTPSAPTRSSGAPDSRWSRRSSAMPAWTRPPSTWGWPGRTWTASCRRMRCSCKAKPA